MWTYFSLHGNWAVWVHGLIGFWLKFKFVGISIVGRRSIFGMVVFTGLVLYFLRFLIFFAIWVQTFAGNGLVDDI